MLESLCWRVVKPGPPPATLPNMPSWIWASGAGKPSFHLIERSGREGVKIIADFSLVSLDIRSNESSS